MRYHELLKLYGLDPRIFDIIEETVGRDGETAEGNGTLELGGHSGRTCGQCSVIQDAPPEEMEDETLYHCYTKEEFVSLSDPGLRIFSSNRESHVHRTSAVMKGKMLHLWNEPCPSR